ncbi:aspartate aminotransferase family protein [Clostridium gasigenes]|uniref:aspartate aminotransferase family protein n=1 Tax=Clostridium gasigenes TaxID=94869 RepID=UPI001C0C9CFB|nr:aspartate aminotransferase family protein [Clostridium gasigenes]MBU3137063.1 aspartate aminotransferase family protein [Clostridium gasigenes]
MFNEESNCIMNTYAYLPVNLVYGDGCYVFDDNNNKYIDFTSGIGVNCLGYNNKKWVDAVSKQASTLAHISNIFLNETTLKLCKNLTNISNMSKVFLSNSGAEANEGAIKLARKYSFDKYGINRNVILSLKQSFHGRTLATLTATGQDKFHNYFFPFPEGFDYVEVNNIDSFKSKLGNNVCAIILEAIQGEGGVTPLDTSFAMEVVKMCNEKDILVIFDEVQCGIGRTGKLFGFNHLDVTPDIITIAKGLGGGLPIGGFLCNEKLSNVLTPGDHGTTYGGNPIACAGALVVLNEVCTNMNLEEITNKGDFLKGLLENLNLPIIKEIRGTGLMIGIETTIDAALIQKKALEKGLLVLTAGKNVVRLLPPLIIEKVDILAGFKILEKILETL